LEVQNLRKTKFLHQIGIEAREKWVKEDLLKTRLSLKIFSKILEKV
jgi:hypothetical protein